MMVRRTLVGVALILAAVSVGASAVAQTEGLELTVRDTRLGVDGTTELVVNVTGPAKPDVLEASAFTVIEQGEVVGDVDVTPFLEADAADIVVALAIDVSGSMRGEPMDLTRSASINLVEELTDLGVRIQLITFAGSVDVLSEPTDDAATLTTMLSDLEAEGGTALYDAVIASVAALLEQDEGTQLNLVVFSDGGDRSSSATLDDALAVVDAGELPVTLVALDTPDLEPPALEAIAQASDGRVLTAGDTAQLAAVFGEVASDIASQYLLTYTSDNIEPATLDLEVIVAASNAEASRTFTIINTREATPPPPPAPAVIDAGGSFFARTEVLYIGLLTAFVAVLLILALMFTGTRTRADKVLGDQLARYLEGSDQRAGRSGAVAAHFRDRAMAVFESTPRPRGFDVKLAKRLEQASWPLRTTEFLALSILLALGIGMLTGALVNWLGGILLGLIAGSVPWFILEVRRGRRRDAFLRSLPDTLQLMAGSLRAGYGVLQAIDAVAQEAGGPTAEEFRRVLTEARLGMPIEDALEEMSDRIENDDFRWVVLAINIQREVGGNLAELLDTVAEVLREREMLRRQVKVLSAEGRLSAIVLIGLPIVLAIYLILVRPEYVGSLVTSGFLGWSMVIGASVLMLIGVVWIRRLIQIEV